MFFLFGFTSIGENNNAVWTKVSSPVFSNLQCIRFFNDTTGLIGCSEILIFQNGKWEKLRPQPPVKVSVVFPFNYDSYYISSDNDYQESDLFYLENGRWFRKENPLANNIYSMYFLDKNNGVVGGYGEVSLLKNGHWRFLPVPVNAVIKNILMSDDSLIWAFFEKFGLFVYKNDNWTKVPGSKKVKKIIIKNKKVYSLNDNFFGLINKDLSVDTLLKDNRLEKINDFYIVDDDKIFFAGNEGIILEFKDHDLRMFQPVLENLNAIWMLNENEGWAVGDGGTILHYSDKIISYDSGKCWNGFKRITFNSNAKVVDDEYGVAAADFNNDGLIDIFTCGLFESNHLYINKGNGNFGDKAQHWRVTGGKSDGVHELNLGCCAADFNNDGCIDLYVTSLNTKNKLYKNFKAKYFIDFSGFSGGVGEDNDRTNSVISGDVDNDGDLDIFITNENSTNRLYLNNGAGIFKEYTKEANLTSDYGGMGCSFSDIDNDGDIDLFVANWSKENILYKNLYKETGEIVFKDVTESSGVGGKPYAKSNGVVFADIDNDGDQDLYVTNRKLSNRLYLNDGKGRFVDKTKELTGLDSLKSYGVIIADFNGDTYKDIYVSNVGKNTLFINYKGEKFIDESEKYDADIGGYSTGSALADYDNDGNMEIYVADYIGESSGLLQNFNKCDAPVIIDFRGVKNNKNGIGAKIYLYKKDSGFSKEKLICFFEVSGGSGYASMNQYFLPVYIGDNDVVDLKITLPAGDTLLFKNIVRGASLKIEDASGLQKYLMQLTQILTNIFKDPLNFLKFIKILFGLLILIIGMRLGYKRYNWGALFIIIFSALLILLFCVQSCIFENRNMISYFIVPVIFEIAIILIVSLFYERFRIAMLSSHQQDQIREKLSRDLHDELASSISTIAIYLTLIKYNLKNKDKKVVELLDKTLDIASSTSSVITDLIWAIRTKPESIESLFDRISNNFSVLFAEKSIAYKLYVEPSAEKIILNAKVKRNIYLIVKEALNNILKYANADKVEIKVISQKNQVKFIVSDNGKGFDFDIVKSKGHGLSNMISRAEEIDLDIKINSEPDGGTDIIFTMGI